MGIEKKAEKYSKFITKEEGNSCNFYNVYAEEKGNKRWMVTENTTKGTWSCTCLFFTLKGTPCSHIRASQIYNERL